MNSKGNKCLMKTYMKTIDRLESDKSENYVLSRFYILWRQFQRLRHFRLLCIFDILKAQGRSVDQKFDRFGCLVWYRRVYGNGTDANRLIKLDGDDKINISKLRIMIKIQGPTTNRDI